MRFKVNKRIVLTSDFDTGIGIIVAAGNNGTIIDRDGVTGDLEVLLDEPEPGLEHWRNLITVTSEDYDKIRPIDFRFHRFLYIFSTSVAVLSFMIIGCWHDFDRFGYEHTLARPVVTPATAGPLRQQCSGGRPAAPLVAPTGG